jgi:hypothetical protein
MSRKSDRSSAAAGRGDAARKKQWGRVCPAAHAQAFYFIVVDIWVIDVWVVDIRAGGESQWIAPDGNTAKAANGIEL